MPRLWERRHIGATPSGWVTHRYLIHTIRVVVVAELTKGQNASLPSEAPHVRVLVTWAYSEEEVELDASMLLLGDGGRVRSDDDFVFYNQPASPDGSVRYLGGSSTDAGGQAALAVDLENLPTDVVAVAVTASMNSGSIGDVADLCLRVVDGVGVSVATYRVDGVADETALVLGELYRRGDGWKVRAIGQGWASGLAGLAQDFGVTVSDDVSDNDSGDVVTDRSAPGAVAWHDAELAGSGGIEATDSDELVDVVEAEPGSSDGSLAPVVELPELETTAIMAAPRNRDARTRSRGVQTRKRLTVRTAFPALRLAADESWTPARLFSIAGVGNAEEQEKRATSALLATMMAVRPFGRGITARLGAPAGVVETFLEVPFSLGESIVIPDGVIRVARGSRLWTGLLETKTGSGQLRREQVENYLSVARRQGFDAVITLSNEIAPGVEEHPVSVDRRKLGKIALFHLSWAEVLHEAQMVLSHRGVDDPMQAWLLHEFTRYLEHPRSGAAGFDDMGQSWVPVREAVAAGTLRAGDRKVPAVVESWMRLVRHLGLRLTAELGVDVAQVLPRKLATDPAARVRAGVDELAARGSLSATLKVPGAVGPLVLVADIRTGQVRVTTKVAAPQEGTAQRRISWLLRQLKNAPDDLLVDVSFVGTSESTCEQLRDVRHKPVALLPSTKAEVAAFTLTRTLPLGTKRSGLRGAFIPSVVHAVESFYAEVLQPMRPWVPAAPKLPPDTVDAGQLDEESGPVIADSAG